MTDQPQGCARVTGAVLGDPSPDVPVAQSNDEMTKEETMAARVGAFIGLFAVGGKTDYG